MYFADGPGSLACVGAYGLPAGAGAARAVAGGLTIEAYRQNRLLETNDVPADFFPVTAGIGQGRARQLLIAPTSADGLANGALELGFFGGVLPADLQLLRLIAEPVGIALRSARDRARLRETLEETQRQAEELQSQQEEMSVQNEELEQQGTVLRESQARLENQQAELEQINAHLEEQTQTLERQRDDLARAQGELQRSSTYKSEFLANMSHELRTPLNSSLILAKLLADNREGNLNAEQIKFAETIYSAGNDLLTLINDILDLSKIEAGKLDVRPEEISLARAVDELADVFRPLSRDKGIDLEDDARSPVFRRRSSRTRQPAPAAGAEEPAVERHQVHRAGRRLAARAARGRAHRLRGQGHGHRHRRRPARRDLRGVPAGRRHDEPEVRRNGARSLDLARPEPALGRRADARERARARQHVHARPADGARRAGRAETRAGAVERPRRAARHRRRGRRHHRRRPPGAGERS